MPEGNDIVERLVLGGNLHQHHTAFAPVIVRRDPGARTFLVEHAVVLVVGKPAVALQQAKATRIIVNKRIYPQGARIDQWPPQPFALPVQDRQPVRIVNFRAPVISHTAIILTGLVHTGQWRDPHPLNGFSRVYRRIHAHHHVPSRGQRKGIGTGRAG